MIQRIQSIFLISIILLMTLVLFFPIWEKRVSEKVNTNVDAFHITYVKSNTDGRDTILKETSIYIAILAIITVIIASTSLFSYKNRITQLKLGAINSLLLTLTLGACIYCSFQANKLTNTEGSGEYLLGLFLIITSILLNIISNRFIRRDENLVKSADRMR